VFISLILAKKKKKVLLLKIKKTFIKKIDLSIFRNIYLEYILLMYAIRVIKGKKKKKELMSYNISFFGRINEL
jgi:hypothetical protein